MPRRRLDTELVRRGLVADRAEARAAVESGRVTVRGNPATKTTTLVASDAPVHISTPGQRYVSRGGEKLRAALDRFEIVVAGRGCLDAGASAGGFTDCLLQAGAARVITVDVGYGQLAWGLRNDPRVTVFERTNIRDVLRERLPFVPDLVVADLSFISLRTALPSLVRASADDAELVVLVKPQFEAAPVRVERGGVVRDRAVWREVIDGVADVARREGLGVLGATVSPVAGSAGNVEFLLHLGKGMDDVAFDLDALVAEGEAVAR